MEDAPDSSCSPSALLPNCAEPVTAPPEVAGSEVPAISARGAIWWEVAAVLAVAVIPHCVSTVSHLCAPLPASVPPSPYWLDAFNLIVLGACTVLVTLYLIARSGEPWHRFGLFRPQILDAPLGALFLIVAVGLLYLLPALPDLGIQGTSQFSRPQSAGDYALMVVKYLVAALAEELVTRAYLITRLTTLLQSRGEAVLCAACLFASYHAYQGLVGVAYSFAFGITYGAVFLAIHRVWPLVIGHALYNCWVELVAS